MASLIIAVVKSMRWLPLRERIKPRWATKVPSFHVLLSLVPALVYLGCTLGCNGILYVDAGVDTDADAGADIDMDAGLDTDDDAYVDSEPDTDTNTDTDSGTDIGADSDANTAPCNVNVFTKDYEDSNPANQWSFSLGEPSVVPNTPTVPIYPWFPDGHIASLPVCDGNGNWMMFWSEFENFRSIGTSPYPEDQVALVPVHSIFGSRGNWDGYDNGGSWLMSVFRVSGDELIGFFHAEDHWYPHQDNDVAWKSLGVTHSYDNGVSWAPGKQMITSDQPKPVSPKWGGSGDTCVVWDWKNDRWTCFFQESTLRLAISQDHQGVPGSWYKWHNGEFKSPGIGGMADPLPNLPGGANPSVHWNTYLQKWVMVYAGWSPPDVLITASDDLVHWEPTRMAASSSVGGRAWYVTIIGQDDKVAGQTAKIYYADIQPDFSSRKFISRTITFTRNDSKKANKLHIGTTQAKS